MKVLIAGVNYSPELTGIGKYTGGMAEWLAERGHEIRVVTAPPYYPEWQVHDGYSPWRYKTEMWLGVRVYRCPIYVPSQPSGLRRILHLFSFAISSLPLMLRLVFWRPDVIVGIEPPLFCAPSVWMASRLAGAKCWLHVQDFEMDAAFALGLLSSPRLRSLVSSLESWLLRRFDRVSSISASMVERLQKKGVRAERTVLFRNWSDLERIRYDGEAAASFRQSYKVPEETFIALYSGNMGEKQGLELVLEAAALLHEENILFVLCGEGAARQRLMKLAKGMGNVLFLELQPLHLLPAMLSAADVHLIIQKQSAADLVMPSKLTNILAVGGSSIVSADIDSELGRLFVEHPYLGTLCLPGDAADFAACVFRHMRLEVPDPRPRIRSYAEQHLDVGLVLKGFEDSLESLA